MSSGKREPVNKLVLGPVHTLHETNGKRAGDVFWYEPNYVGPIRPRTSSIEWQELRKFEKSVRRKLSKSSYRERLEDFIRQYTRALDSRDWNGDFIRLWGLFEQLTSAERGVDAIKRALFLYHSSDRTFNRQVLNHLRIYRNRTIHAGEQETEEIETLLYQLKGYVDELLLFHIRWAGEFSSFEKAIDFLNQSPDTTILQDRMNLLTKALQFHAQ
jgi:hypothetical protein